MEEFLSYGAATLAPDEHAALVIDGAGWHVAGALRVPENVTLVPLPPYSPELNAIERLWQVMRDTLLSHRPFTDLNHIIEVCCTTWNTLVNQPAGSDPHAAMPERLRSKLPELGISRPRSR